MNRYLIEVYGISESAILLEPHARHTTTNLRNGMREILAYNLLKHAGYGSKGNRKSEE